MKNIGKLLIQSSPKINYPKKFSSINRKASTGLYQSICKTVSQLCELCTEHGGSDIEQML